MKKLFFVLFFIGCCTTIFSQTTVTFKPGPTIGQDANIGSGPNMPNTNYGNSVDFNAVAWTWNSVPGTVRLLKKFDELSTIPASATIISAELRLYGVSSSTFASGNSTYPGSPYAGSNKSFIQKVTSPWNEQTVTWATQPTTTTVDQITIPQSTSRWNYNFFDSSPSLVAMVQDWVSNPATNHGFMIRLETETRYRGLLFASSDHSDPNLWPELIVTYIDCEADFSYTVNTANPNIYVFTASNSAVEHHWRIDGTPVSNAASFYHYFSPGSYNICYVGVFDDSKCEECIAICVHKPIKSNGTQDLDEEMETKTEVKQGEISGWDEVILDAEQIKIYPNPTTNEWNVNINTEKEEAVKIQLSDINGKIVYSSDKMLTLGDNGFAIGSDNLKPGHYILKITGSTIQFSDRLIKNQ